MIHFQLIRSPFRLNNIELYRLDGPNLESIDCRYAAYDMPGYRIVWKLDIIENCNCYDDEIVN